MDDLEGKVAFISGGAGGIGQGMARAFAEAGMKIGLADNNAEALGQAVARLEASGAAVTGVLLDVTDLDGWLAAAETVRSALGPVQLLCNNAGVATVGLRVEDMAPELWHRLVSINLDSVYYGVRSVLGQMREAGGGHVVNTSSMSGLIGGKPGYGGYVATKFAVVGLSEVLRAELAADNVGVSVVCPGAVRTSLRRNSAQAFGLAPPSADSAAGSASPDAIDPDRFGLRIVQAVRANELYVITHPELRAAVVHRHERLMAAFDRGDAATSMLRPTAEDVAAAQRSARAFNAGIDFSES